MRNTFLLLCCFLFPAVAAARTYDTSNLPYSDAPTERSTAIAISVLTQEGVVEGNPDGTFRPGAFLNRAEFLKIAMTLLPAATQPAYELTCFPDVFANEWYAPHVCRAKALGIVEGNQEEGIAPELWEFQPARTVQYVEALKILSVVFNLNPTATVGPWYQRYLNVADALGINLPENPAPGMYLTRGDMARLVVRFLAQSHGELAALSAAEKGNIPIDAGEEEQDQADTSNTAEVFPLLENTGAVLELDPLDPDSDTVVMQQFLPLGEVSPVLAGASIFSEAQPLDVTSVVVRIMDVQSIDSFLVYDENTRLLGRAYMDTVQQGAFIEYRLPLQRGKLTIPKEKEFSFYVRAVVKAIHAGGVSGDVVQVQRIGVEGNGAWNNKNQSAYSTDTFPVFQTAQSTITEISNPSGPRTILLAGNQMRIGAFRFAGHIAEGAQNPDLAVTELVIQADQIGGVTLDNVWLGADGTNERSACTLIGSQITCSDIPVIFGSFEDRPRILTLYADVRIPSGASKASLQLRLNEPGSVAEAGAVRWTDGSQSFHWVAGETPVVRSTVFEY
ncbi:MAG: S-layer homology domain-containing protein [Candidatus Peribacteraceae bacterium]|nr:S-layer homology domain-containing protein [Candidatus Peribacteraceae bacterium]